MNGRPWSAAELTLLRDLYPDVPAADVAALLARPLGGVHQAAARLGLKKSVHFNRSDSSGRVQRGRQHPDMVAHQFRPGFTPWNKGIAFDSGGRSHQTRFQPGSKPHTWLPLGSYRINADGYIDQKISEQPGPASGRWEAVHRLVWAAAHGPIPPGHIVTFKPGRRTTVLALITADALDCITRAEHARRNHPRSKSPELARLVQLKGAINRQVNRITREAQERSPAP